MEDNNNKKNKYPSIPSNFVTLVQLQEKWIKEQQRKQTEKEQQQQQQQLKAEEKLIHRNTVEKAVVAVENENESAVKQVKIEESSSPSKKKKKKKKKEMQWRKRDKEKIQFRAEEVKEGETHAPPPERRVWEKKVMRSEYRAKSNNNAVVQSENVVEIDPKFGNLSMNTGSGEGKNDGAVRANGNFNRRERRGGYGSHREMRRGPSSGPGVVWVKKGEVVDGIIAPVAQ